MVKQCVTLHKCVCNFTHSFWFCKFMLFFREEISVTIYARFCVKFSHIKLCWWKIWGMMRMFLMILMFITVMIKRIWIASDQIVLWIHSQWYNALKHLQNKMVEMIKMDVMLSTFPSKFFVATKLFLSSTKSIVFLLANIVLTSGGNCHEDPAVARSVIGEKTGRAVRNETRSGISCSLCLWNPGKDSSWIFEENHRRERAFPLLRGIYLLSQRAKQRGRSESI